MKKSKIVICMIMTMLLLIAFVPNGKIEAKSAYVTTVTKFLKAMKAKKYGKAQTYADKMKKTKDTSLKKMSKKQKKAYKNVLKKYPFQPSFGVQKSDNSLDSYYLADLNKDKKPELLVKCGTCEADYRTDIYTFKRNKAVKVGTVGSGHTMYIPYPGNGVIQFWAHQGYTNVSVLQMKKGKLKSVNYGGQTYEVSGNALVFPSNELYSHRKYDSNYTPSLDLKDLK